MAKTITAAMVTKAANTKLAGDFLSADVRRGIIMLTESILSSAGKYNGFRYLRADEVPASAAPGINFVGGKMPESIAKRFANTDATRIFFL